MSKQHKGWGRDSREMRLMPGQEPPYMKGSFYPQIQGIVKKTFDMLGDLMMRHDMGQDIRINNVGDFYKISSAMAQLTKAAVEIERWELEKTRRIEDISEILKTELGGLLANEPDLYAQMKPLIDQAAALVAERYVPQRHELPPVEVDIN